MQGHIVAGARQVHGGRGADRNFGILSAWQTRRRDELRRPERNLAGESLFIRMSPFTTATAGAGLIDRFGRRRRTHSQPVRVS